MCAPVQIQQIDQSYEVFMKAARWSGDADGDTDDLSAMPRGPQGPAPPKGGKPGVAKADKGGPSPGKKGGGADGKVPSPGKKGMGAAAAADMAPEPQALDGRLHQPAAAAQQALSMLGQPLGGYHMAGPFAGIPYGGGGGFVGAGPRPPLAPMGGAAGPSGYMGVQGGGGSHVPMHMYNGGLQGLPGGGEGVAGGGERRLPEAYAPPGRFLSEMQQLPPQQHMPFMHGYQGGPSARQVQQPPFGGGFGGFGAKGAGPLGV